MTTNNPYGQPQENAGQWQPTQDPAAPAVSSANEAPGYGSQPGTYGSANEAPGYGQQSPYGAQTQQTYAQPAGGQFGYAGGEQFKQGQAIAVTILGVLSNIVSLIFGILALVKGGTDPVQANKYVKWGWIAFIAGVVLWVLLMIILFVLGAAGAAAGY